MADIKDSVGRGGVNRAHDVALVQALLVVVKNAKGHGYLNLYDGIYGNNTKTAIANYQQDHGLALPPPAAAKGALPAVKAVAKLGAKVAQEKQGFVAAGGPTIKHLSTAAAKTKQSDLRIIPETKVVYWPGSQADAAKHAANIRGNGDLEATFRENVAKLVEEMYGQHKIVLSIPPKSGGLRTFEKQYLLATTKTKSGGFTTGAGPGESNHNFGMAVDIGFNGFKWLKRAGLPHVDDFWLNDMESRKASDLWEARNKIAKTLGLFKTTFAGDLIHLQNFDDAKISMSRSLAALLNTVGAMRWKVVGQTYSCDLGLGGAHHAVGKAEEVWGLKAIITATTLAAAQKAAGKAMKADAAAAQAMKVKLKADFEAAEANRHKWKPMP